MTRQIAITDVNGALEYVAYNGEANPAGFITRAALEGYATTSQLDARIAALVGAAPGALDTLAEVAAQLQRDESGAAALAALVATKQDAAQVQAAINAGTAAGIAGVLAVAHGGTGGATAQEARAGLQLGTAALLPVGTAAGTVAAGDDPRILAAQTAPQVSQAIAGQLAGYSTSSTVAAQIAQAVAGGIAANISGVAGLAHGGTGGTTAPEARAGLGLGPAALLAVGVAPGTVAAGNDARFAEAAKRAANLSDLSNPALARASLGLAAVAASGAYADLSGAPPDPRSLGYITAAALDGYATSSQLNAQIANLVGSAPGTLDTIAELAAQLQQDESGAAALASLVATKQDAAQVRSLIAQGTALDISGVLSVSHGGTGAATAAAARSALGAQAALGFTPVEQGGGAGQAGNRLRLGWSGAKLKAQVDALDLGALALESWVAGAYAPLSGPSFTNTTTFTGPAVAKAGLRLEGSGVTPARTFRIENGKLQILNSAGSVAGVSFDDDGSATVANMTAYRTQSAIANVFGALTGANSWGRNQGSFLGWNFASGGGRTDFVNSRGGGPGGFDFWNVATDAAAAPQLLLRVDAAGGLTTPDGALATQAWVDRAFTRALSVRAFGATGDGAANDTAAFRAAIAAATAAGCAVHVPAGRFRLTERLVVSGRGFVLRGEGIGVSILEWAAGAADARGFSVSLDQDTHPCIVTELSLWTQGQGGTAIVVDCTPQIVPNDGNPVVVNRSSPRVAMRDVSIRASSDPTTQWWSVGCEVISGVICVYDNFNFEGGYNLANTSAYRATQGIYVHGDGHPTQVTVNASSFYGVVNAINCVGIEGLHVGTTNCVGVTNGIVFDDSGNATGARPLVVVTGSHVNACGACVLVNNGTEAIISHNDFYFCTDATQAGGYGVFLNGPFTTSCQVTGNNFSNSHPTLSATAIYLKQVRNTLIDGNVFRKYTGAGFSGIQISEDCRGCKISDNNHFTVDNGAPGDYGFRIRDQGLGTILAGAGITMTRQNSNQVVAANTAPMLAFDTLILFRSNNKWWGPENPTRLLVPVPGSYRAQATVQWDSTAGGTRSVRMRRNGGYQPGLGVVSQPASPGVVTIQNLSSTLIQCQAGDYFELELGSSVNAVVAGGTTTAFSIERVCD